MSVESSAVTAIEVKAEMVWKNMVGITEAMEVNNDPRLGKALIDRCAVFETIHWYEKGEIPLCSLNAFVTEIYDEYHK